MQHKISFQIKNDKVTANLIWNDFMGKQQTARVEDPCASSGITSFDKRQVTRGVLPSLVTPQGFCAGYKSFCYVRLWFECYAPARSRTETFRDDSGGEKRF